jgi:hypothetical protein
MLQTEPEQGRVEELLKLKSLMVFLLQGVEVMGVPVLPSWESS